MSRGAPAAPLRIARRVERPHSRNSLELVVSALLEGDARARDEVLHRSGHEHFARGGERRDSSPGDHGDARELLADQLALARMDARTDLEVVLARAFDDSPRARDRPCGAVESTEEAVPGRVDLLATMNGQLPANVRVVAAHEISPRAVSECGRTTRR